MLFCLDAFECGSQAAVVSLLDGSPFGNDSHGDGCGSGVETASCYQKVAGLIPLDFVQDTETPKRVLWPLHFSCTYISGFKCDVLYLY